MNIRGTRTRLKKSISIVYPEGNEFVNISDTCVNIQDTKNKWVG